MLNIWSIIIGLFAVAVGLVGLVAPADLGTIAENATTAAGAWALAAALIVIGIVLLRAAATARIPIVIRAAGVIAFVAGIAIPFAGSQLVAWWVAQGPQMIRLTSVVKMAFGAVIVYSANP